MKNKFLFSFLLVIAPLLAGAQSGKRIMLGVNVYPMLSNSYEFVGGYKINKNLEWTLKLGYAGKTGIRFTGKMDDFFSGKTHSGYFAKTGLRVVVWSRVFVSAEFILSQYVNAGYDDREDPPLYVRSEGVIAGLGISPGYRHHLITDKLFVDFGLQFGFAQRRNDYVGTVNHNYQPGLGSFGGNPFVQGICAFMLRI